MNRDEQKSRAPEKSPYLWDKKNIFAPQDSVGGGTWIACDGHGAVAMLLNGYKASDTRQSQKQSRGEIVPALLQGRDINPKYYNSFDAFLLKEGILKHFSWDRAQYREQLIEFDPWFFFTSSSYAADKILPYRQKAFLEWQESGAEFQGPLPAIHAMQNHTNKAYPSLMDRPDACTKSITQYEITAADITVRYWAEPVQNLSYQTYQTLFLG